MISWGCGGGEEVRGEDSGGAEAGCGKEGGEVLGGRRRGAQRRWDVGCRERVVELGAEETGEVFCGEGGGGSRARGGVR